MFTLCSLTSFTFLGLWFYLPFWNLLLWIWLGTLFTLWIPILPAILGHLDVTLAWDFVYVVDYNFACCFGTFRHDFVLWLFLCCGLWFCLPFRNLSPSLWLGTCLRFGLWLCLLFFGLNAIFWISLSWSWSLLLCLSLACLPHESTQVCFQSSPVMHWVLSVFMVFGSCQNLSATIMNPAD